MGWGGLGSYLARAFGEPSEEEGLSEEVRFEQRNMGTSGPGGALSSWQEQWVPGPEE